MPATPEEKAALGKLSPRQVRDVEVAGEKIVAKFCRRSRQRRGNWRDQDRYRTRMVRRPALRNRGCVQVLCRKHERDRAPAPDSGRRPRPDRASAEHAGSELGAGSQGRTKIETGNRITGNSKSEASRCLAQTLGPQRQHIPISAGDYWRSEFSNFEFPISSFQFRVSILAGREK